MKLRTKIRVYSSIVVVILMFIINTAIFVLFQHISVQAEMDRMKRDTNIMMEAIASNQDSAAVTKDLLKAYIPSDGMIRIINSENKPIHEITKSTDFYDLPIDYVRAESQKVMKGEGGIRYAMVSIPIIWSNGEVMTLQVTEKLTTLEETMTTLSYVLLVASLMMVVPIVLGAGFLGNFLLKPIQKLTNAMTENRKQGKWKKIDISSRSKDELFQMGCTYNQMIDRLQESFERQEQFVSDASHELKTPVSIIKSYAQLLQRQGKTNPEVYEEATQVIRSETTRMEQMVQQMLMLAKNQDQQHLYYETVNLSPIIRESIKAFSTTYQRKITLFSDLQTVDINCDGQRIKEVLYILIDNACKYSRDEIRIFVNPFQHHLEIAIQDFGEGISDADQNRIFDRFYRVDQARSRDTGGTGLGLSIAKDIVQSHGGRISVASKSGEGTVFTFTLPYNL